MTNNVLVKIERFQNGKKVRYTAKDKNGKDWASEILSARLKKAYENGHALRMGTYKDGRLYWKETPISEFNESPAPDMSENEKTKVYKNVNTLPVEQLEVLKQLENSYGSKPKKLIMSELKWRFLIRNILRGKNIMMTGPAGSGKTIAAKAARMALNRPSFDFNLGATQDPRTFLIGNTQFEKNKGTFFNKSMFVKAIETPNACILLDEISRAHPDAHNILMTVLDDGQRYLRLDEEINSPIINVAEGVSFIATANIGNEYTATRIMDRALVDRFTQIEMDVLNVNQEIELLTMLYPNLDKFLIDAVANIAVMTRQELETEAPKIPTAMSTRMTVEMVSLLFDGFTLEEAAEVCLYPYYSKEGGNQSERTFIKQIVQKYIVKKSNKSNKKETTEEDDVLFTAEEIENAQD